MTNCRRGHTYDGALSLACPTCATEASTRMLRELQERGIAERFKVYRLSHVTLDDAWWKQTLRRSGTSIEEVPALCGALMPLADIRTGVKYANSKPEQPRVSPCSKCEARIREILNKSTGIQV